MCITNLTSARGAVRYATDPSRKQRHARTCYFLDSHQATFLQLDTVIGPIPRNNRIASFHTISVKPKRSDKCDANTKRSGACDANNSFTSLYISEYYGKSFVCCAMELHTMTSSYTINNFMRVFNVLHYFIT